MKPLVLTMALLLAATAAGAQDVSGRALLTYELYDNDHQNTSGFRQSYDLGLQGALTTTSIVRLLFHADEFRAATEIDDGGTRKSGLRVLQPTGELILNTATLQVLLRSDYYDTRSHAEGLESDRTLERSVAHVLWAPRRQLQFSVNGQRNLTKDSFFGVRNLDESATGALNYGWRGIQMGATERFTHSTEETFDRTVLSHQGSMDYATSQLGGRLVVNANASAALNTTDEELLGNGTSEVPIPVTIARALYGVDDTPSDTRDHPLLPLPSLSDGNLEVGAPGVTLGPTSVSFQNLAIDLGRIDRADEIRVVVRDRSGNPLRNGGGPVTFDVYVSEDGFVWTPNVIAQTTFNRSLSRYEVAFTQTGSRWFKVVNFGVNVEETLVTEVQAVYHTQIAAGEQRSGTDRLYNGGASIVVKPVRRVTFFYNGAYNSLHRQYTNTLDSDSTFVEHLGSLEYEILRPLSIRGEYSTREATSSLGAGREDSVESQTVFLQYRPTRALRLIGEVGRQDQVLDDSTFTLDTRAIHVDASILRSLSILLNGGTQTQTIQPDQSRSVRHFLDLTGQARLTRSLRLLLMASMQRVDASSADAAVQLLGVTRDDRASAEVIWRPGRPLMLAGRVGYVSGVELSGLTHRLRAEWYPFADGALVLGGYYDQDIDPVLDRSVTRAVFNPRWNINRWAAFDLNYTSVSLRSQSSRTRQRTLFATLTFTR